MYKVLLTNNFKHCTIMNTMIETFTYNASTINHNLMAETLINFNNNDCEVFIQSH